MGGDVVCCICFIHLISSLGFLYVTEKASEAAAAADSVCTDREVTEITSSSSRGSPVKLSNSKPQLLIKPVSISPVPPAATDGEATYSSVQDVSHKCVVSSGLLYQ